MLDDKEVEIGSSAGIDDKVGGGVGGSGSVGGGLVLVLLSL